MLPAGEASPKPVLTEPSARSSGTWLLPWLTRSALSALLLVPLLKALQQFGMWAIQVGEI